MPAFRAEAAARPWFRAGFALLVLPPFLLLQGHATAQAQTEMPASAPPIRLGPPVPLLPPGASLPAAAPATAVPAGGSVTASGSAPPTVGEIAGAPLAPPDPDAAGVIGMAEHALPDTLWHDTPRATVDALLPNLAPSPAPSLQDLAFRLLASPAAAPVVEPGTTPAAPLIALRAQALAVFGHADAALHLLQAIPNLQADEATARVALDLALLSGNDDSACTLARQRNTAWQDPYWDKAQVTCAVLGGRSSDAQLGLDMLREEHAADAGFTALVDRATGLADTLPGTLPDPQPMALALLDKAGGTQPGVALPAKALDGASLALIRAVATAPGLPVLTRLVAAEKAAAYGALPPDRLAEAYLALPREQADKDMPLSRAQQFPGARGRAILFAAARDETQPIAIANYAMLFLGKAEAAGLYEAGVQAAQQILLQLAPSADLQPHAAEMARALYALNRPAEARRWYDLAPPPVQQSLLPLARIVGGDPAPDWGPAPVLATATGAEAAGHAALAAMILAAEGTPAPDRALLPLLAGGGAGWQDPAGGPPLLLDNAAAGHRLGGTVLAVLATLGGQGGSAPAPLIAQAIRALRSVGLEDEAHRLAIDAAIAGGV